MSRGTDAAGTPSPRVLVVDDEVHVRGVLKRMLARLAPGVIVDEAGTAEDAIRCLEAREYRLLLSDLTMPGKPGTHLLAHARVQQPGCWRVLMTGHNEVESSAEQADLADAAPQVTINKPIVLMELKGLLGKLGFAVREGVQSPLG